MNVPLRVENAVDLHCHFHVDSVGGFFPDLGETIPRPVASYEEFRLLRLPFA